MKRCAVLLLTALALTACTSKPAPTTVVTAPEATVPKQEYDYTYDMDDYQWLSQIFEEKSPEYWELRGKYTMLLEGLCTPVVLEMEGQDVLSVSAYGHTEVVNCPSVEGSVSVDICDTATTVVVNEDLDYSGRSWIFTPEACFGLVPDGGISTQVRVYEDGSLRYTRYWGEYATTFNQDEFAPLYLCTSRDHFLYETGQVEITDGLLSMSREETIVVSDAYDLDALFLEAQSLGYFAEYDNVDELLQANGSK